MSGLGEFLQVGGVREVSGERAALAAPEAATGAANAARPCLATPRQVVGLLIFTCQRTVIIGQCVRGGGKGGGLLRAFSAMEAHMAK
jgi:hypothetical protein